MIELNEPSTIGGKYRGIVIALVSNIDGEQKASQCYISEESIVDAQRNDIDWLREVRSQLNSDFKKKYGKSY